MNSTKKTARVAGLLYLLAGIPAPFALIYIPRTLIVPGNATATARNILASESLFRIGIAGELINAAFFLFVPLALYRLLNGVNKGQASLMVTLFAVSVPISFVNALNSIAALILVRGTDFLSVFDQSQREALAMLFLRLHSQGFVAAQIFWGLWLFPLGLLVCRSGFLPRILGILLIVNSIAYPVSSFTSLLLPHYGPIVSRLMMPLYLGELWFMLWLLIKGAKDQPLAAAAAS